MARTKGRYVTRGRGEELERQIRDVEQRLGERVAAAEARASAAEERANAIYGALLNLVKKPATRKAT